MFLCNILQKCYILTAECLFFRDKLMAPNGPQWPRGARSITNVSSLFTYYQHYQFLSISHIQNNKTDLIKSEQTLPA